MISFLSPLALVGLALLAIPVLVHLFKPRRARQTPFSSLRWLHLTQQRLARRIQWHQILLFLLRAAFILALVLALARPQYGGAGSSGRVIERFLVLDNSRSMGYQTATGAPLTTAKRVVAELIRASSVGDRAAVLVVSSQARLLSPLTETPELCLPAVSAVTTGIAGTNLAAALPLIRSQLAACRSDAEVEICVVTDNHQQAWSIGGVQAFTAALPRPVKLRIIDVSPPAPENAWVADARVTVDARANRLLMVELGSCGGTEHERLLQIRTADGSENQTRSVRLLPGQTQQIQLPLGEGAAAGIVTVALEPPDKLPDDDKCSVDLAGRGALRVLLVEPEVPPGAARPGLHLTAAARALSQSHRYLQVTAKARTELLPSDILNADLVVFADVDQLADAALAALETRVADGVGLIVFPGPSANQAFYNGRLYRETSARSLLSRPLAGAAQPAGAATAPLTDVDWSQPLFSGLLDTSVGDIALTQVRRYQRFGASEKADRVIAAVDGEFPAILTHQVGSGRVVVFAWPCDDSWTDWPRRNSFVPFIDRLFTYAAGGSRQRQFIGGEPISLTLPGVSADGITVSAPGGEPAAAVVSAVPGGAAVRIASPERAGVYRIDCGTDPVPVFVRPDLHDSILTAADNERVAAAWSPVSVTMTRAEELDASAVGRRSLWPWLLGVACLLLIAEMYFVHHLCPRVNPVVVVPIVRHRRTPASAATPGEGES